jgi:hypothetical protein
VERPWARHYQHVWHERTADGRLPLWLRVAFLAMGSHRANGHARFKAGEIGMVFGTIDADTGEIRPQDKHHVQRAIKSAVERGWLSEGSSSLCLIVPAHAIEGGVGYPSERCPIHERKRGRR